MEGRRFESLDGNILIKTLSRVRLIEVNICHAGRPAAISGALKTKENLDCGLRRNHGKKI